MNYKRTIDLRQIECFMACVQMGSISKAAEALHMAQPSVSKAVKAMEESLGIQLFKRYAKGILLTPEGEDVYQYAKKISDNLKEMQALPVKSRKDTLRFSSNPSSWFADTFLEFYRTHRKDDLHYQIYSAGTREIVQRLQERMDDVGFVYVIKNQKAAFQYYLTRSYLEFMPLTETLVMLFTGEGADGCADELSELRLIQRFPDEFSPDNYWDIIDENGNSVESAETVVTTNSEYIMTRLLQEGDLQNISAAYLTPHGTGAVRETRLNGLKEDKIIFGCVKRRGEKLTEGTEEFVRFVERKLKTGKQSSDK
ncbi:MAG: LysR family transcriptional regulator [Lachnospiraceae bacterium]|nr:LysR family transcriptional regulator [Lachnospiraceae bacterium]